MSTFYPAASSLANFIDALSTISTIRILIYISCSHQNKNQRLSWHHSSHSLGDYTVNSKSTRRTYTRESKLSVVAVPRYQLFTQRLHRERISTAQYRQSIRLNLLSCTRATKEASQFWGHGQFLPSLLTTYWVLRAYFLAVSVISVCAY